MGLDVAEKEIEVKKIMAKQGRGFWFKTDK